MESTIIFLICWASIGSFLGLKADKIFEHGMHKECPFSIPVQRRPDMVGFCGGIFLGPFAVILLLLSIGFLPTNVKFLDAFMSKTGINYNK